MAALANIRHVERECLRGLLLPGYLVQVSGPPMAGKLTVVNQVLRTMEDASRLQGSLYPSSHAGPFIFHQFSCKHAQNGLEVLKVMAANLMLPLPCTDDLGFLSRCVQAQLKTVLQTTDGLKTPCHHIIIFEKCETLVTHDADPWFLAFLSELMYVLKRHLVTVVFTSYKRFEWSAGFHYHARDGMVIGPIQDGDGNVCCTLEIGQLLDSDILSLLRHFAPLVDPNPYLHIFQRYLGFPEAVRRVAQTFLLALGQGGDAAFNSESLDTLIKTDMSFLHSLFSSRLDEVMDWVGWENLLILRHLGSSLDSSATSDCFRSVAVGETECHRWTSLSFLLSRFYVIRELPGVQRLVVHPLVIYFCRTQLKAILVSLRGRETNLFSNRFTHFLCATLSSLDACSSLRGRQLTVVSSMLYECPNIRHVISMALLANEDSYTVYLKLAISGAGMLSLLCPREVINFYACLCKRSKKCGRSLTEQAILRGLYGQALAWGTGTGSVSKPSGSHWQESTEHLSQAIDILSRPGVEPSYYLLLFLSEKAKIRARQGKYDESLRCFKRARDLFGHIRTHALGESFAVTETKLRETVLITLLYETVPMIFKGNNAVAKERLTCLVDQIEQEFPNSMELPTAHNQLGLSEQRGRSCPESLEKAKTCYWNCLRLRTLFRKINPIPLYAPFNNVAMICYRRKEFGQFYGLLEDALKISRDFDWLHYYTGLTLVHLAEGSIGLGHFKSAMIYLKESERVLKLTAKDHDLRLRALLELAHVRVALTHQPVQQPSVCQPTLPRDGELVVSAKGMCQPKLPCDGELVASAKGMCQPISETDMEKTARDHLDRLSEVAKEMDGTYSDDGHHFILSAFEHALLLNWAEPERVEEFRTYIFEHIEKNKFEKLFREENPSAYHNLHKHRDLYFYLKECSENHQEIDLRTFIEKQVPACTICKYGQHFFTEDMWFREISRLVEKHRAMASLTQPPGICQGCQPRQGFPDHMNACSVQSSNSDGLVDMGIGLEDLNHRLSHHRTEAKNIALGGDPLPSPPSARTIASPYVPGYHQFAGLGIAHLDPNNRLCNFTSEGSQLKPSENGAVGYCDNECLESRPREDATNSPDMYVLQGHPLGQVTNPDGESCEALRLCLLKRRLREQQNIICSNENLYPHHPSSLQPNPCGGSGQGRYREPVEHTEPPEASCTGSDDPLGGVLRRPVEHEDAVATWGANTGLNALSPTGHLQGFNFGQTFNRRVPMPVEDTCPMSPGSSLVRGALRGGQHLFQDSHTSQVPSHCQIDRLSFHSECESCTGNNQSPASPLNANFEGSHAHEKAVYRDKDLTLEHGLKELNLSRNSLYNPNTQNHSSHISSSSGLGSMCRSETEMNDMPSVPPSFLLRRQSRQTEQPRRTDFTRSMPDNSAGARPKTIKQRSKSQQH